MIKIESEEEELVYVNFVGYMGVPKDQVKSTFVSELTNGEFTKLVKYKHGQVVANHFPVTITQAVIIDDEC